VKYTAGVSHLDRRQFLAAAVPVAIAAASETARPYPEQLYDIYPVPPLARRNDAKRSLNFPENEKFFRFLRDGGVTRFVYGGNAFLYQITLAEYAELTHWLGGLTSQATIIPAVGPSFGRAVDQAALIRRYKFPSVLVLPTGDPRDAAGLERGMREIAEACGIPLSLYVKRENDFGDDLRAGIDVIGRLVDSKVCVSIKYAVVRKDPSVDSYLTALLQRVDRSRIISGIGERPAIVHLRNFGLTGFTTGSGVLAPKLCRALLDACSRKDYEQAEKLRAVFLPLEDLRDEWGPPRVIHAAVALAGVAETGPIPPFVSELTAAQKERLRPVARELLQRNG
jgi:dihydrodipicolinate synthase/N-acetylneuraminate lyase